LKGREILRESAAVLLAGAVVLLALSLYSYSPQDPSFNHATDAIARNQVGIVGAYMSDFLYQLFGYASWLIVALALALAVRIGLGIRPWLGGWTSLFWLPVLLAAAALMHAHGAGFTGEYAVVPAGFGGAFGKLLAENLGRGLHAIGRDVLLLALLLSSFVTASHISMLRIAARTGVMLGAGWQAASRWYAAIARGLQERRARVGVQQERRQKKQAAASAPRKKAAPKVGTKAQTAVSRRARQEQQVELALKEPARGFKLPNLDLFNVRHAKGKSRSPEALQAMARMLEKKLLDYRVEGEVVAVQPGPVVTQFEFEPAPGTKVSRVAALQDDLARAMSAVSVRVAGNIPGKSVIGIEIPNEEREMVLMHDVLASREFSDQRHMLPLALGVDIAGNPVVTDLVRMPHLLIAGTTGSGKSVAVNSMICSMLTIHSPHDLRLILVDPKMLELSAYEDIPHLLVPVVTQPHKAAKALAWAVYEMERRYRLLSEHKVRNIASYNKAVHTMKAGDGEQPERLPYIVIVVDELADLMMVAGREVEQSICRLAQKARAAGIHLILATQRPSVDVITGLIKANLPSRISFQVSSRVDSRTILDQIGAEQLLGQGDMLFLSGGRELRRVHGAFVSDGEVAALAAHLKEQGAPDYRDEILEVGGEEPGGATADEDDDPKFDEAVALVIDRGQCSASMIQRHLRVGYNRASRMVERMERDGLVTAPGAGGIRKVLARRPEDGGGVVE